MEYGHEASSKEPWCRIRVLGSDYRDGLHPFKGESENQEQTENDTDTVCNL